MHLTQPTVLVQNRMGKELGFEFLDFNTTKRENMIHKQTQTKLTNHNNFTLSQLTHTLQILDVKCSLLPVRQLHPWSTLIFEHRTTAPFLLGRGLELI